jgi:hypothetical protein
MEPLVSHLVLVTFETTWARLKATAPQAFTDADKSMAKLFYDIGAADVIARINESVQPFVAFPKRPV